jgi:hypothetical protein
MEIKLSTESVNVARAGDCPPKQTRPATAEGAASFQQSAALEQRLNQLPDVRAEEVERGQKLVSLTQYPPIEMMDKIARLLAVSFDNAE